MSHKFEPIDLSGVKTYPLSQRKSKVSTAAFAKTWQKGSNFKDFLDRLPDILAGNHLKTVISSTVKAFRENKTIVFAMGAHVIKVGLNPHCYRSHGARNYHGCRYEWCRNYS